ncbi:MAG: hypothetical protein H6908_00480 [Hyphomicrobiales bacterium]|nr:hypothetical protein [Hyphomicrobiales bacterium]
MRYSVAAAIPVMAPVAPAALENHFHTFPAEPLVGVGAVDMLRLAVAVEAPLLPPVGTAALPLLEGVEAVGGLPDN